MSLLVKRTIPLIMTFIVTVLFLGNYYFKIPLLATPEGYLLNFSVIILTFALWPGVLNIFFLHGRRIIKRKAGQWLYSIILLASFIFTVGFGLIYGVNGKEFNYLYDNTINQIYPTMMAIFIVWIAPAFVRYMRIRSTGSAIMVSLLVIVLITGSPIGLVISPQLSNLITNWLNTVPNMGAQRGLQITVALGIILMSLRIITGREKSFLRKEVGE